ncbi:hypothetical protein EVAR_81829_1 [Eumeta japonica]|uniref:Uncharacterized protein n=1 Tax=Eumeta variegata TaxID=151549 RepID=A0A4C1XT56_EUMVA|nr:hypothetical protein EVAR_81829_1 [Eumeta japonica]
MAGSSSMSISDNFAKAASRSLPKVGSGATCRVELPGLACPPAIVQRRVIGGHEKGRALRPIVDTTLVRFSFCKIELFDGGEMLLGRWEVLWRL